MSMHVLAELWKSVSYITGHPLNQGNKAMALLRWLRWQLGARLLPAEYLFPLVNQTRMILCRGMTGATGCYYCGLDEYREMAFVLHALRLGDLFVDCGANVGVYTLLASSANASCISFEPIPETYEILRRNVALNELGDRVILWNMGLGSGPGRLRFTSGMDTINHVVYEVDSVTKFVEVPMASLDQVLAAQRPLIVKIDVEGYETEVVAGAADVLSGNGPLAVIIELRGHGSNYGFNEDVLHEQFISLGFKNCIYDPVQRSLVESDDKFLHTDRIYCRDIEFFSERVVSAGRYRLSNHAQV